MSLTILILKTDSTANVRIFKITWRASVVESLFSKVTGGSFLFYNSFENSITCIGAFKKVPLPEILRNSLLTEVAVLHSLRSVASSNINEVIKTVLNVLLFFYEKILHAEKSTKKHQMHKKHKNITKQKHKYANKRTKIKNTLEKHLRGKRPLIRLFVYLCLRRKKK